MLGRMASLTTIIFKYLQDLLEPPSCHPPLEVLPPAGGESTRSVAQPGDVFLGKNPILSDIPGGI